MKGEQQMKDYDKDDFNIGENPKLRRVYSYQPYSHWQIKKVLASWGIELIPIGGYKWNRGWDKQHYCLVNKTTREVVNPNLTNYTLRLFMARKMIPLETYVEKEGTYDSTGRNIKAQHFLEIATQIKK